MATLSTLLDVVVIRDLVNKLDLVDAWQVMALQDSGSAGAASSRQNH
jgi:hypothetical protein